MEKKYYFRGLGLGIIVTAVIMGIALSGGGRKELTDEEIIARAKALGMTENTRLLEAPEADESQAEDKEPAKDVVVVQPKAEEKLTDAAEKEAQKEEPPGAVKSGLQEKAETKSDAAREKKSGADTNEMTKQDEDTGQVKSSEEASLQQTQTVSGKNVTIVSGDGSFTVAKKLEEAGLVSSASAYDDFLCQNGYDKKLRAGTFQIPADASEEQIARIVTGQQ